jgi:lysozyme
MRSQLIENLQPTDVDLKKAGIHVGCNGPHDKVYYSSDEEDESPWPPRTKVNRTVVAKPVLQVHEVKQMRPSQKGVDTVASHEGLSTKAYKVAGGGNETIGYGHETLPGEDFSQGITRAEALDLLDKDMNKALVEVQKTVTVPLKQHQLDALVSYVFNVGSIRKTQLLKKLNAGDFEGAAREMDVVTQKGTGKVLPGLVKRRAAEQKLFLYGYDK